MTKTLTVSLHANIYQVDLVLVWRRIELVFDPFDLTTVEARLGGVPAGLAQGVNYVALTVNDVTICTLIGS